MATRYLLISEQRGVFLGTHITYALFAADSTLDIVKAYTFDDEKTAHSFANARIGMEQEDYSLKPIESDEKYVHVVDIIKAGYEDYVYDLANNIQMISYQVH